MWAFSFLLHFICLCFLGRCALVAERSRSVEHSFTEKSRISAALNDRDFFEMLRMDRGGANEKARLQK